MSQFVPVAPSSILAVGAALVALLGGLHFPPHKHHRHPRGDQPVAAAPPVPAVVTENSLPGTPGWDGPLAPTPAADVYASATDAMPGDSVALHVSTAPSMPYRVLVYRLGWYGGVGARQVACLPSCDGWEQGAALGNGHARNDGAWAADWTTTDTLQVDPSWVSGYYLIRVLLLDGPYRGDDATTFLVVDSPKPTRMLIQVPVDTWQAYDAWGGASAYDFAGLKPRLNHLTFDRPYLWTAVGGQGPLGWEYPFVRFVERNGYDVSYQSDTFTDAHPESLLTHRLVAVPGHSEYWSKKMRDAFDSARDQGVNLAFLGANAAYWQVRLEDGGRTMVAYKSMYDPEPNTYLKTAMFRELIPQRAECALVGIQHEGAFPLYWPPGDYTVRPDVLGDPWMAGTGFMAGDSIPGVVSVESDTLPPGADPGNTCGNKLTIFFERRNGGPFDGDADATRYTAPSGAMVFASGSLQFSWGLDDYLQTSLGRPSLVDPRLQRFMKNALDAMTR